MNDARNMDEISLLFVEIVDLAHHRGARNLSAMGKCWETDVDDSWWFAINATGKDLRCSKGVPVPARTAYVEFNGFPFALVSPWTGVTGCGEVANEDSLIEAIRRARWPDGEGL